MGLIDDSLEFVSESEGTPPWKVLVVDDEPEIHQVTRLVLGNFRFADRPLQLISAYSSSEAEALLREHADTAVMLLDVVMETDQAGLDLVRIVRERLKNQFVRIVLRTGQPGQAPEHEVVAAYDINDYKTKTELTRGKLFTTVTAAIRSFDQIQRLEASRSGLEKIIRGSSQFSAEQGLPSFAKAVIEQLSDLLGIPPNGIPRAPPAAHPGLRGLVG